MVFSYNTALTGGTPPGVKKNPPSKTKIKNLDERYRVWWDLVYHIITPTERNVFRELSNNRDRDAFINLFWKLRDPTGGTPENEFKEEHLKRFNYANRYFKYGSPLPGWKTDRGRIYILLGPPVNRNEVEQKGLRPVLIWEYHGGVKKGLPTVFRVVFYKKSDADFYRLYLPAVDGPASLLRSGIGTVDVNDYASIYDKIREIEPAVADICLSLVPGEGSQGFRPSLRDPMLISKIAELPKKQINAAYARNFLNYKGLVETSVITNYLDLKSDLCILKDPRLGLNVLHLALLPNRVSVDYSPEKDRYYFNFNLMVLLKKGEQVVFQYNKDYPLYYTKEELDRKLSHGLIITDYFPVVEGDFQVVAILQNTINKELSYFQKHINVPAVNTSVPRLYGPLVAYRAVPRQRPVFSAFQVKGNELKIDPRNTFGLRDRLDVVFSVDTAGSSPAPAVRLEVSCLDEKRPYKKTYSFQLSEGKQTEFVSQRLENLNYGNYRVTLTTMDSNNKPMETKVKDFTVSPSSNVPHPPLAVKSLSHENRYALYSMVAHQYTNLKKENKALEFYEKAFALNKTSPQLIKMYASLLLRQKQYDNVRMVVKNLKDNPRERFSFHSFTGRSLYGKGRYREAAEHLLKANKIYDSDIAVLNTLGLTLIRLDNKTEAINALSASLKLNDQQKEVARILRQLKSETQKK